jgi:hypothetical protein
LRKRDPGEALSFRSRHTLAPALLFAILLIAPVSAAGRDDVIASLPVSGTPIDALRGRVMYSQASPSGYRLVEYRKGNVGPLPIAPSALPFEVDLGPDRSGTVVAVYARCSHAPTYEPHDEGPYGCDLYRYDFERRRETPISGANSALDERHPAIWKGRLAFTRLETGRAYWRRLSGRGPNHRLAKRARPCSLVDIDIRGVRAAVFCFGVFGGGDVRLVRLGGKTRTLAVLPGAAEPPWRSYIALGVSMTPGFVYWMASQNQDLPHDAELRRYDLHKRREERGQVDVSPRVTAFGEDGGTGYYLIPEDPTCNVVWSCAPPYALHRSTDLRFERARPIWID